MLEQQDERILSPCDLEVTTSATAANYKSHGFLGERNKNLACLVPGCSVLLAQHNPLFSGICACMYGSVCVHVYIHKKYVHTYGVCTYTYAHIWIYWLESSSSLILLFPENIAGPHFPDFHTIIATLTRL